MTPRAALAHDILSVLPGSTAAVAAACGRPLGQVGRWLRRQAARGHVRRINGRTCGRGNATTWSRG